MMRRWNLVRRDVVHGAGDVQGEAVEVTNSQVGVSMLCLRRVQVVELERRTLRAQHVL